MYALVPIPLVIYVFVPNVMVALLQERHANEKGKPKEIFIDQADLLKL